MNLFADEGVDRQIVQRLREEGHQVLYVAELEPSISDESILARARDNDTTLLTADKDFGELVYRQSQITSGVILIRLAGLTPGTKASVVSAAISQHAHELPGAFTVIAPGAIRIRSL
jgi:predicted nuclease of predicted toxin-antitoxin system